MTRKLVLVQSNVLSRGATCAAIGHTRSNKVKRRLSIFGTGKIDGECIGTLKEEFYRELERLGDPSI